MFQPDHTPPSIYSGAVDSLEEMTAMSSPSGDPDGLWRAAEHLATQLARRGLTAKVHRVASAGSTRDLPMVTAGGPDADPESDAPVLLAIGHFDTVLPAIPPRFEGERLWATGAVDMKAGLVTLLGALDLLAEQGGRASDDLLLVVVPDEEIAGPISHDAMRRFGDRARGVLCLEPGMARGTGADASETVVIGRRGTFHWSLDATGRSAHAGNDYWQGRSALVATAEWATAAEGLAREGNGPTVNAGRMVAGEAGFLDDLAGNASLLGTHRQTNVVPDRARVEGECRFLTLDDDRAVRNRLAELAEEIGTRRGVRLVFEAGDTVPPLDPRGAGRRWAERAVALAADRGWRLEIETERGGISFPNFMTDPSAVPVVDGLGPAGGGMHTREEWVDLRSFDRRIALLADLLRWIEADESA